MTATVDGTVASKIDGDNDANQTHLSATLPVTVNPGEVVMLRWTDVDEQGEDQALAIDDLVVTSTIEGQGVESIQKSGANCRKYLKNGQVIIIRDNIEYTILGNKL